MDWDLLDLPPLKIIRVGPGKIYFCVGCNLGASNRGIEGGLIRSGDGPRNGRART
jgi:hypothetical protein